MSIIRELVNARSSEAFVLPKLSAATLILREYFQAEESDAEAVGCYSGDAKPVRLTSFTNNIMNWEK